MHLFYSNPLKLTLGVKEKTGNTTVGFLYHPPTLPECNKFEITALLLRKKVNETFRNTVCLCPFDNALLLLLIATILSFVVSVFSRTVALVEKKSGCANADLLI